MAKKENPFEIKTDLEYGGNRSANSAIIEALAEQCMKLDPENRRQSVNIPVTVCPNRGSASNIFLTMRRYLANSKNKEHKTAAFTSRGVYSTDSKKTYLGSRIWRIK